MRTSLTAARPKQAVYAAWQRDIRRDICNFTTRSPLTLTVLAFVGPALKADASPLIGGRALQMKLSRTLIDFFQSNRRENSQCLVMEASASGIS